MVDELFKLKGQPTFKQDYKVKLQYNPGSQDQPDTLPEPSVIEKLKAVDRQVQRP